MRILAIHNTYQQPGGEDAVFEAETTLLENNGHPVERIIFNNQDIRSGLSKLKAGIFSIYNPESASRLQAGIRSFQPDIIHVHNFFPLGSPSLFVTASKQQIPLVHTLHNYRLLCGNATFMREGQVCTSCVGQFFPLDGIRHACYRKSRPQTAILTTSMALNTRLGLWRKSINRFIALCEFERTLFLQGGLGLKEQQVVVKPNFIFDPGDKPCPRDTFFLYIGRLSEEKGIHILLQAFAETGYPLKIVGSGPLSDLVEQTAQRHDNITFLAHQPKDNVFSLMRSCQALVFPSIWYETFGLTIIEAFATGTPVLASKIGAPADLVEHGQNGYHFEPASVEALVNCLRQFQQHLPDWPRLSQNARTTYLEQYTPEVNYKRLMSIYGEAIHAQAAKTNNH